MPVQQYVINTLTSSICQITALRRDRKEQNRLWGGQGSPTGTLHWQPRVPLHCLPQAKALCSGLAPVRCRARAHTVARTVAMRS